MKAPIEILKVWNQFNHFPMETLTKAWYFEKSPTRKQREVELMQEHYERYGITGNCFDLAIWLLHAFKKAKIAAYPIGTNLHTGDAHVAVIALDSDGNRFLCDLGDQWIQPILVERLCTNYSEERLTGFFPGAKVSVKITGHIAQLFYYRANGKMSEQTYTLLPITMEQFLLAAEASQNIVKRKPLIECRIFAEDEVSHWEFYNWKSWRSTNSGKYDDLQLKTNDEWVERIHKYTKFDRSFIKDALKLYTNNK